MNKTGRRAFLVGPMLDAPARLRARLRAFKITRADLVIAIDAGVESCRRLGLTPRCAVGDWDSFTGELPAEVIRLTLPRAKDRNDLHFAAALAVAAGARELVFLGITGGRPDHQLANLYEVGALASIEGVRQVMIAGEDADYWFLGKSARSWSGKLPRGALASVFALGGTARGVSLTGFRYPLRDASLKLSSRGLSNEVTSAAGVCRVGLRSGSLMLIAPCR